MGKNKVKKSLTSASDSVEKMKKMAPHLRKELNNLVEQVFQKCSSPPPVGGNKEWEEYMEIHDLVQKIREMERDYTNLNWSREQSLKAFMQWASENGISNESVKITSYPDDGCGLEAVKSIQEAELWLTVPRKLMLTTLTAQKSKLGALVSRDPILLHMPNIVLALHLLCERLEKKSSFWEPYINILPTSYTIPLYFSQEEMQILKGSLAFEEGLKQFRNIARQYSYFYRVFQLTHEGKQLSLREHFTFDAYRWAVATVMTRQNPIPSPDGTKMIIGLIPMFDMANHASGKIYTDFNVEKDRLECFGPRNINEGEQVFMFYGVRSNVDLLVHNGFVYPQNEHDSVGIKLGLSKNDELLSERSNLMSRLGIPVSGTFYISGGPIAVDGKLLGFLRIQAMDETTLRDWLGKEDCESLCQLDQTPVSAEQEQVCWQFLYTRISLILRSYATPSLKDESLAETSDATVHSRLCLSLRTCEKGILHRCLQFIHTHAKITSN